MPERSMLAQKVQWGVETVEGTAVPANKLLPSIGVDLSVEATIDRYRAMGYNWTTITTLLNESSAGDLEGRPDFNGIVYPLSSAISTAVITTPATGVNSRQWVHTLLAQGPDTRKSFTIEQGDASFAERAPGVVIKDFNLAISPTSMEIGGSVIGKKLETGVTLTAGPTAVALQPVTPLHFNVYADDTQAALGTTKLTRALSANFGVSDRWGPVWTIDRALAGGYAATIQTEPDSGCDLTVMADTVGLAFLTAMRSGAKKYIRLEAVGPIIEAAIAYKFQLDFAATIGDSPSFEDQDDVRAITLPLKLASDATWGKAAEITVVNVMTAL